MESATDAEVIVRSLAEAEAFSVIFERHHDTIFRYVGRRVGADRAADLTADVFLRAFRLRHRYDSTRSSCRPWLYGIATNIIGDDLRRFRRRQRIYLVASRIIPATDDPYARSDDRLVAGAASRELNLALGALRSGDRDVLLLYAVEELTYQETADVLQIPIGTVRSRLARARRIVRELIPDPEQRTSRDDGAES